jgi:hypothetical protein
MVPKRASVTVLKQPGMVTVTAADIKRGFVDASDVAQVAVQCNSPLGYLLEFAVEGAFRKQGIVLSLASDNEMGAVGPGGPRPCHGMGLANSIVNLRFRFILPEQTRAGSYGWPVRLSVSPI